MRDVDRSAWLTAAIVSVAAFMVTIELTIIALALPEIRDSLPGASGAWLVWVVNAYSIVVAALLVLAGWLADRHGHKRVFRLGLVIFAVGSFAAGAAGSTEILVAARTLQAVGGAMQLPAGMALLLLAFPAHRRQLAISTWSATAGFAAAVGPTAGGLLIAVAGWRSVFYINVPIALIALLASRRVLVDSDGIRGEGRVDVLGVPLASLGVGAIILGVVQGESWGWDGVATLGSFGTGVALIGLFVARSLRHPAPLFDLNLLRIRSFALGNLGTLFFCVGFFAVLVPLPSFLQDVWGWSVTGTGFAMAAGAVVSFIVSPQAGRLADRIGNAPILVFGSICGATALLWMVAAIGTQPSVARLLAGTLLLGVASGTGFSQLVGAALRDVPPHRYAMATAGRTTFFQLSIAVAIAVAFTIIGEPVGLHDSLSAYKVQWSVSSVGFLCNLFLFGFVFPRGAPVQSPHPS